MSKKFKIHYSNYDLPADIKTSDKISVDTEAMGLVTNRDRLCVVQIRIESDIYIVHFPDPKYNNSPNLKKLLMDHTIKKFMHYAPFDMEIIARYLGVLLYNVICTRTLSKITHTFSNKHGLKHLCKNLLNIELNKTCQSSYWGSDKLSKEQIQYAAQDVYYLEDLYEKLLLIGNKENRINVFNSMMKILPHAIYIKINSFNVGELIEH